MSAEPLPGAPADVPRRARLAPVRAVPPPPETAPFAAQADPAPRPARTDPATVPTPRPDTHDAHDAPQVHRPDGGVHRAPEPTPATQPDDAGPAPAPAPAPARPRPSPRPRQPAAARETPQAPEAPEVRAARVVRESWAEIEPHVDEVAGWFAALLFSLAPDTRALFPTQVTAPSRRLLRSMLLPMTTLDRPGELTGALEPLVAEHRGLGLAPEHYESLGVALVGAMRRFAGARWGPDTERAWAQAFALVAEPMQDVLRAATSPAVVEAQVVEHRRLGWDLAIVRVAPLSPLTWSAGQHLPVEIPARPRMWRHLSPAGAPRADGTLEFHVRAVEGGWVSRAMVAHTRPGDVWRLGPARGRLTLDHPDGADVLAVAGGTGVAPVLSLCEALVERGGAGPEVSVLVGGRRPEDLYALERLDALAARTSRIAVGAVCEEDPLDTDTVPGTLPDVVVRAGDWSAHHVVVAGSPAMTRATVSALLVAGVGLDRIHYDPFTE